MDEPSLLNAVPIFSTWISCDVATKPSSDTYLRTSGDVPDAVAYNEISISERHSPQIRPPYSYCEMQTEPVINSDIPPPSAPRLSLQRNL